MVCRRRNDGSPGYGGGNYGEEADAGINLGGVADCVDRGESPAGDEEMAGRQSAAGDGDADHPVRHCSHRTIGK